MGRGVLLLLVIVVATLAVAEIAGRTISWQPSPETDTGTPRQGLTANAIGDWTPNQRGVWIDVLAHPYFTVVNDAGFRNIEDLDPKAVRILALGDSYTFGLTVSNYETWVHLAEKILRQRTGKRLQILNNGIPGSTIVDHLAYLREKGRAVEPDFVLLVVFSNDVTDLRKAATSLGFHRASEIEAHDSVFLGEIRWWLRQHSGLYSLARRLKEWFLIKQFEHERTDAGVPLNRIAEATSLGASPTKEELARYGALVVEAVNRCRDLGARPVIVHLPAPSAGDDGLESVLREIAARTKSEMIELRPAYSGYDRDLLVWSRNPDLDPDYEGDSHLTRLGNTLVGRAFADAFAAILSTAPETRP